MFTSIRAPAPWVPSSSTIPDTYGTTGARSRVQRVAHDGEAVHGAGAGQLHPLDVEAAGTRSRSASGGSRNVPQLGAPRARRAGPPVPRPRTAAWWIGVGVASAWSGTRPCGPHRTSWSSSSSPTSGAACRPRAAATVPPVTRAISAPSTWLTAVPRSCSTASRTWVMPMMYASERLPPWVLTGIEPVPQRMLPSATNGAALADRAEAVVLELHEDHRREVVVEQRHVDVGGPDARHLVHPLGAGTAGPRRRGRPPPSGASSRSRAPSARCRRAPSP